MKRSDRHNKNPFENKDNSFKNGKSKKMLVAGVVCLSLATATGGIMYAANVSSNKKEEILAKQPKEEIVSALDKLYTDKDKVYISPDVDDVTLSSLKEAIESQKYNQELYMESFKPAEEKYNYQKSLESIYSASESSVNSKKITNYLFNGEGFDKRYAVKKSVKRDDLKKSLAELNNLGYSDGWNTIMENAILEAQNQITRNEEIQKDIKEFKELKDPSKIILENESTRINDKIKEVKNTLVKKDFEKEVEEIKNEKTKIIEKKLKDDEVKKLQEEELAKSKAEEERVKEETEKAPQTASNSPKQKNNVVDWISDSNVGQEATQILTVVSTGGYKANISYLNKNNGTWSVSEEAVGEVGDRGIGPTGDNMFTSPYGLYTLNLSFGMHPDFGSKLPYKQITPRSHWSGVLDDTYNTWVEKDVTGDNDERLIDFSEQYEYAMAFDYDKGIGGGSAFFLHVSNGMSTAGCVAIPRDMMKRMIIELGPNAKILIVNDMSQIGEF